MNQINHFPIFNSLTHVLLVSDTIAAGLNHADCLKYHYG